MATRLTVGLPVYRAAAHMPATLRCLQEQTFGDFEAIISVDGGDTETADACEPFLSDKRFRMTVHPTRLDWFGNFNWLLQQDLNEFFCYRQHDDTTTPDFFAKLLDLANARPDAAAIYCDCQWTGGRKDVEFAPSIEGDPLSRLFQHIEQLQPVACRGLLRRDAIRQAGLVRSDEFRGLSEIFVWLAKVLRWGAFLRLPEALYLRLDHPDNYHKDYRTWPDERRRAAWTTMFTGMLEAVLPLCQTPEERLYAQHVILDRIIVVRAGRPYLYLPNSPQSSGRLILESFERLEHEGNMHLLGSDEPPAGLHTGSFQQALATQCTDAVAAAQELRTQIAALSRERDRLANEVARLNSSRMLKLGRRIRRMLGRPDA